MRRFEFNLRYLLGKPRWDTGLVPPEVEAFVASYPPGRFLDLGCGTGTNLLYLARHGWQVVGVDFSQLAVLAARKRLRTAGVQADVWVDDVTRLTKVQDEYNYILDIGCYHQLNQDSRRAYQANLERLLAPGGVMMMYGHCSVPDGSPEHGLTEDDINEMGGILDLQQRVDGQEGARRPSVWLWFKQKGQ
jgi:SAM-dependent methyltransferase